MSEQAKVKGTTYRFVMEIVCLPGEKKFDSISIETSRQNEGEDSEVISTGGGWPGRKLGRGEAGTAAKTFGSGIRAFIEDRKIERYPAVKPRKVAGAAVVVESGEAASAAGPTKTPKAAKASK